MFQHKHWRGPNYGNDSDKQRFAIVGYSHYRQSTEPDFEGFTHWVMEKEVLAGDKNTSRFFKQIAGYFDRDTDFWNDVVFFNFIPYCIGTEGDKFREGCPSDNQHGRERVLRILREERPNSVIVFTTKGWQAFPPTIEERRLDIGTQHLGDGFPAKFRSGTYRFNNLVVKAYGLRHPQGADSELMRKAVQRIVADKSKSPFSLCG